jgi:hypothetical protein
VQIPKTKKSDPDVLRVTAFVLRNSGTEGAFSVCGAAKTDELNGISHYRIAEILKEICLQPNGPNSMDSLTTVDDSNSHNNPGNWTLNSQAYFSYLSYLSILQSEKTNKIAKYSMWIAIAAIVITLFNSYF